MVHKYSGVHTVVGVVDATAHGPRVGRSGDVERLLGSCEIGPRSTGDAVDARCMVYGV
jgi:hypothetical protein